MPSTAKRSKTPTRKAARRKTTGRKTASRSTAARKTSGRRPTTARRNGRQPDVIALIKADHATVNDLFRRYQGLGDRALKSKRQVAERVIKELSVHAAVEEQVLYPTVRRAVPDGASLVREAISEHQSLKEALATLDKCPPDDDRFDALMKEIRDEVRHHVKEEESSSGMLAKLRKNVSRDDLQQMAKITKGAKKGAPTRPHPMAPATPPGNVVVGAAAGVVDKVRDKLAGRR